jgi:serine/threonine-protein kinase RsbW
VTELINGADDPIDDQTMGGPTSPRPAQPRDLMIVVPALAECLRDVRSRFRAWLSEQSWPADSADDIELATNEAVSNVIDHAYLPDAPGKVHLHAWASSHPQTRDRRVVVTVIDRGRWAAHHPDTYPQDSRGHGLLMMRACVAEVHIQSSAAGTTVILISEVTRPDQPS